MRKRSRKIKKKIDDFSFWEHLEDLRVKILWAIGVFFVFFLVAYFYLSLRLITFLVHFSGLKLYYISVFEPFLSRVKVSAFSALVVSIPFFILQVLRFVLPGLLPHERKVLVLLTVVVFVFSGATGFVLFWFSPYLLRLFVKTFAISAIYYHFSVSTFLNFYVMLALVDLVLVLIPAITYLLLKMEILKVENIGKVRRFVIPVTMFIAALVTPPDPLSMIIVALPLWLLFEVSVFVFRLGRLKDR